MERRKFLIGAGSTAVGASALVGSGAFSVVRADRDMTVEVVDDDGAYLTLDPNSAYAELDDGMLAIDFAGGTAEQNGEGLNDEADSRFDDVFRIENKGTNTIRLSVHDTAGTVGWDDDSPLALYWSSDEDTASGEWKNFPNTADPASFPAERPEIGPGEDIYVHFIFWLQDRHGLGDEDDISDNLGIYAEEA